MPRRLGQHFLKNQSAITKIINALGITAGDTIIEVGPGHGELTERLLSSPAGQIIAIEKDRQLTEDLGFMIQDSGFRIQDSPHQTPHSGDDAGQAPSASSGQARFKIIEGDVLKILLSTTYALKPKSYKIIGNIPYYLTGYLFRTIGELEHKPSLIVFTLQKEVAERVAAKPPKMNLLAASIQIWANSEILDILPSSFFDPPPKVESAVIRLTPKIQDLRFRIQDSEFKIQDYYRLIKILFKQPRKTVLNNLADGLGIPKEKILKIMRRVGLSGDERPQNLSLKTIISLVPIVPF